MLHVEIETCRAHLARAETVGRSRHSRPHPTVLHRVATIANSTTMSTNLIEAPKGCVSLFISLSATEIRKCCLFETAQGHFYRGQATIYCLHLIPWFYFTLLVGLMHRKIWLWCHCFYGDKKNGQGQWGCSVWCIIIWHNTKKSLTQGVIDRSRKLTGCRTFFDLNLLLGPWKLRITQSSK
jgi:hypothetical protein